MKKLKLTKTRISAVVAAVLSSCVVGASHATEGGVTFKDIAANDGAGISYRRGESPREAILDSLRAQPVFFLEQMAVTPEKSRGAPGVAVFDYDRDGDMDIYVTNGPGVANSLYVNKLNDSGELEFVDMAVQSGVAATDMDSSSVCYGDLDNDGDHDLYVLGTGEANRLFENNGDGTFEDATYESELGNQVSFPAGCSMGDINGDGLLDIVVANNSTTWDDRKSVFVPFDFNAHNHLFLNKGENKFEDVSDSSGIQTMVGLPPGAAGRSWAVAMVDYDMDGDVDIIVGDDQAAVPTAEEGGVDRGLIHVFNNNGEGIFTDVSQEAKTTITGAWMGFAFADFNADKNLDMFVTSAGDYLLTLLPNPYKLGKDASRWFLGQDDGSFTDPGVGGLVATTFGWGDVAKDYDNDGDTDIIFYGGIDIGPFVDASNPGTVLRNDGMANFSYDLDALSQSTNHSRRNVQGVASGDINNDGFVDFITVSNFDMPEPLPLVPYSTKYGSQADDTAFFFPSFTPIGPGQFTWSGMTGSDGTLSIEVNSADNGNNWISVELMGTVGLISEGQSNRDGIGAVVTFTPKDGKPSMYPVVGGASYASQDSLKVHAGMGEASRGTLEVLWPGGTVNRYYGVKALSHVMLPEIPCSVDADWDEEDYQECVRESLDELVDEHVIDKKTAARLLGSALRGHKKGKHKKHSS